MWTLTLDPKDPAGHIVQSFIQRPHIRDGFLSLDHQYPTRALLTPKRHLALSGDVVNDPN